MKTILSSVSFTAFSQNPNITANSLQVRKSNEPSALPQNQFSSLTAIKSADAKELSFDLITGTSIDGKFTYETADAPYTADDINIIKLNNTDLDIGALVRQRVSTFSTTYGQDAQSVFDRIIKFENVSNMRNDRSGIFTEGLIVYAGGYRYKVASPVASDHHLTTAGGAKLYLLPINGAIPLEGLDIDKTGVVDETSKLATAGQAARLNLCGISCGRGTIKFSGQKAIDWRGISQINSTADFVRSKDSVAYFVVGGSASATTHSSIKISAYDTSDRFATDRTKKELVRLQGIKHFDLQGRISKVLCFADGNEVGAESGGYGKINAEVYTLEIMSRNGGWFNHVHVYSQRLVKLLSYRSDGSYRINGWTIEGLFELANAEIDLHHIWDVKIRGRFESPPTRFIKLRENTANILVINTNSNGSIQPWYQDWRAVWIGADEGINNRVIHEAHKGLDRRLVAQFSATSVVSDGMNQSCAGKGWMGAATTFKGDGVNFHDANSYVMGSPWIKANKGDVFSSNVDSDGNWCRPCLEIAKVSDGSAPTIDPNVAEHAFNKFPRTSSIWAYTGSTKAEASAGSYYLTKAQDGFDAFMYTGNSGEYYIRIVLRVFAKNSVTVRSAALWWTGRETGTLEADLLKVTNNPALLSSTPISPAPIGTLAHDGTGIRTSTKFEETAVDFTMPTSSTTITFARQCATTTAGDLIMIELDNGQRHITTLTVGTLTGGEISKPIPYSATRGRRVWIGKWI
ncbi:hypothetical protein [Sphingorhabdus sp. Alg231-15]|uniref:hypothetical protein n=1 Tax=Sphingorhabdus sp. Alg231-15 TaxID=1922222 RepID=UPI000D55B9F7